jgi:hypothetical protein
LKAEPLGPVPRFTVNAPGTSAPPMLGLQLRGLLHMRVHAYYGERAMRTTVEIDDRHRARFVALAARRGEKGFSRIIAQAIEQYLQAWIVQKRIERKTLKLRGSLSRRQAECLEKETARIRSSWR